MVVPPSHPHPDHASLLPNLGLRLWDPFRKTVTMTDLEEAILMHRKSLSLCLTPYPASLYLGLGLTERFTMNFWWCRTQLYNFQS